jgi:hypothetical protein
MRKHTLSSATLALLLALAIGLPLDVVSQAARGAGKISRLIPTVNVQRGTRQTVAAMQTALLWGDTLLSQRGGRARVALDDGSILNLGSESSLQITSHDASAQRTQLQLAYGRLRASAVRISRAGGSFEVRTPTAVAGVVGTDFYVLEENGVTTVIVFEGVVSVCDHAGNCVQVHAGEMTTVRTGHHPTTPEKASPSMVMQAGQDTEIGPDVVHKTTGVPKRWVIFGLIITAIIPAILIPAVSGGNGRSGPTSPYECTGPYCG